MNPRYTRALLIMFCVTILSNCGGGTVGSSGGSTDRNRAILGYALDKSGQPFSKATLIMSSDLGETNQSSTNRDGTFAMEAPEGENYTIKFIPNSADEGVSPLTVNYTAKFDINSIIKLRLVQNPQLDFTNEISEASISLTECNSLSVSGRDVIRSSSTTESPSCRALINHSSSSSEVVIFGLFGRCDNQPSQILQRSRPNNKELLIPLSLNPGCTLEAIRELRDQDLAPITFKIYD